MLTNNYYKMYNAGMSAAAENGRADIGYTSNTSNTYRNASVRDVEGNTTALRLYGLIDDLSHAIPLLAKTKPSSRTAMPTTISPSSGKGGNTFLIAIGCGTTAATPDDYNVESIISTLSYISAKGVVDNSGSVYNLKRSLVFQNTGSDTISVSEICLFAKLDGTSGATSAYISATGAPALVCREVLTEPIIVAANEYFTVTLSTDGQVVVA